MKRRHFLTAAATPPALWAASAATAAGPEQHPSFVNVRDPRFGARGDGHADDSRAIQAAIDAAGSGSVLFPPGVYRCSGLRIDSANLAGSGMLATILRGIGDGPVMNLGFVEPHWAYRGIQAMTIDGGETHTDGVRFASAQGAELSGRWAFERVQFFGCATGVHKPTGNIGNSFVNCLFRGNRFGYHATSNVEPIMHTGNDTFDMCHLEGNTVAAIYSDCTVPGGGALKLRETIIENNPGFGLFLNNFTGQYAPVVLDNVWMESNAFDTTVVVDGMERRPCDAFFRNTNRVTIVNGRLEKLELVSSHALVQSAYLVQPGSIRVDEESSIVYDFPHLEYGAPRFGVVQRAPVGAQDLSGPDAPLFRLNPRTMLSFEATSAKVVSASFADADFYNLRAQKRVRAARAADGRLFDACAEVVLPPGMSATVPQTKARMRAGSWTLLTVDMKLMRQAPDGLSIRVMGETEVTGNLAPLLEAGQWVSLGGLSRIKEDGNCELHLVNRGVEPVVLRLSAFQLVQFDRLQRVIDYLNSGFFAMRGSGLRESTSRRAPTSGSWSVGDRVWNALPKPGGALGWVCVQAGAPGRWKSFGTIDS